MSHPEASAFADLNASTDTHIINLDASTSTHLADVKAESESIKSVEGPLGLDHHHYSHRSPWLRAAVLGANDGLVSVGALLIGVVAAGTSNRPTFLGPDPVVLAGLSALIAGALSMALGEYVSVASQKDSELADLRLERLAHEGGPEQRRKELEELTRIYMSRGLDRELAKTVAIELSKNDPVATHARDELGIDVDDLTNPFQAAVTSLLTFSVGAVMPLLVVIFAKTFLLRIVLLVIVNLIFLFVFGAAGSYLGGAPLWKGALRVTIGGGIAMGGTYLAGFAFGTVSS
ncbi:VIT family-domain-containing protein [Polychytrium aggregatum]|uniref:VIT family-domain-containing protein n=1 Tax=Polychytrium aggregatum TaxID=110093 RepID=UPI0022FDDBFD|nr:VIT family-domain-containing protein [Polychytrium aggregatum]KAI9206942.1 VIT family-domain-containing protein [Polychytrium aggregatum]